MQNLREIAAQACRDNATEFQPTLDLICKDMSRTGVTTAVFSDHSLYSDIRGRLNDWFFGHLVELMLLRGVKLSRGTNGGVPSTFIKLGKKYRHEPKTDNPYIARVIDMVALNAQRGILETRCENAHGLCEALISLGAKVTVVKNEVRINIS